MIICCKYENLDLTGAAFCAQFELRHKCFIDRQDYNVRSYCGKEYDQFDTPAAIYLVYMGANGKALGTSRLTPVSHSCMVTELWPQMIRDKAVLKPDNLWEGTRFCIDKDVAADQRREIISELVLAYLEVGLALGMKEIIGIMPIAILRSVFRASGVNYKTLGDPIIIDGMRVQAASMTVNIAQLFEIRKKTGISESVTVPLLHEKNIENLVFHLTKNYEIPWVMPAT